MPNEAMVRKGKNEPLLGLRDQAQYHAELLERYGALIAKRGWKETETTEFLQRKEQVDSEQAERIEQREAAKQATRTEAEAVSAAKEFKYQLDLGLDDLYSTALATGEQLPVERSAFHTGRLGELRRSTPKLIDYLTDIRPKLIPLDERLKPFFEDESPVSLLDSILSDLKTAQGKQEVAVASLPLETQDLYEAKGYLLQMIERINRLGRAAAAGNAPLAALFNKDRLLSSRRAKKKSKTSAQPAA